MTVLIDDPDFTLHVGDVRDVLATLPDESVHCVVTSPPYWGLRDYGTGSWDGGDADCDHQRQSAASRESSGLGIKNGLGPYGDYAATQGGTIAYRDECGKCGARRVDKQLGLEPTPDEYVANMVAVFREVRRVLRRDGTCWLNIGDSYAGTANGRSRFGQGGDDKTIKRPGYEGQNEGGSVDRPLPPGLKQKDLTGIPWRLAFALQADGWYLRSDIIWSKPNPMPESVTDRPTKAHEYLFLLTRSPRYFYDADAIREPHTAPELNGKAFGSGQIGTAKGMEHGGWGNLKERVYNPAGRNRRSVWEIATEPYPDAHFATFPQALVEPCILAGTSERGCCPECGAPWERETARPTGRGQWRPACDHGHEPVGAVVCDPFIGSGTVAVVARRLGRRAIGIELNADYAKLVVERTKQLSLLA